MEPSTERLCDLNEGGLGVLVKLRPVGKMSDPVSEDVVASSNQPCYELDVELAAKQQSGRIETR